MRDPSISVPFWRLCSSLNFSQLFLVVSVFQIQICLFALNDDMNTTEHLRAPPNTTEYDRTRPSTTEHDRTRLRTNSSRSLLIGSGEWRNNLIGLANRIAQTSKECEWPASRVKDARKLSLNLRTVWRNIFNLDWWTNVLAVRKSFLIRRGQKRYDTAAVATWRISCEIATEELQHSGWRWPPTFKIKCKFSLKITNQKIDSGVTTNGLVGHVVRLLCTLLIEI